MDKPVTISSYDHVGINIADLNRSAAWYQRILGFELFHKWTTTWMIRSGEMRIGLFERKNAVPVEDLDQKLAITHFCFLTDSEGFVRAQAALKQFGVPHKPPEDTGIAWSLFFHDPDGHEIEITTYHSTDADNLSTA